MRPHGGVVEDQKHVEMTIEFGIMLYNDLGALTAVLSVDDLAELLARTRALVMLLPKLDGMAEENAVALQALLQRISSVTTKVSSA